MEILCFLLGFLSASMISAGIALRRASKRTLKSEGEDYSDFLNY